MELLNPIAGDNRLMYVPIYRAENIADLLTSQEQIASDVIEHHESLRGIRKGVITVFEGTRKVKSKFDGLSYTPSTTYLVSMKLVSHDPEKDPRSPRGKALIYDDSGELIVDLRNYFKGERGSIGSRDGQNWDRIEYDNWESKVLLYCDSNVNNPYYSLSSVTDIDRLEKEEPEPVVPEARVILNFNPQFV